MRFSLVIEGRPVDLFNDETIQLTRAIKDFLTTAARTDFTQQFNIPSHGGKRSNISKLL
jgi:hypothetical protein